MIKEFFLKRKFDINSDRLGPDCPFTHWKLYFKRSMKIISQDVGNPAKLIKKIGFKS